MKNEQIIKDRLTGLSLADLGALLSHVTPESRHILDANDYMYWERAKLLIWDEIERRTLDIFGEKP